MYSEVVCPALVLQIIVLYKTPGKRELTSQPLSRLACLSTTSTPTPSLSLFLNMHYDLHTSIFQELNGAFADVFEICGTGGDDVYHAEDALFLWRVGVCMVTVVVGVRM